MSNAHELLLDRATRYLMDLAYEVESPLLEPGDSEIAPDHALELGRAQFSAINQVLKDAIDLADLETFREVDGAWSDMFEDVWLVDAEDAAGEDIGLGLDEAAPTAAVRELVRYRDGLRLGLAMWAAHRLEQPGDEDRHQMAADVLQHVAASFGGF